MEALHVVLHLFAEVIDGHSFGGGSGDFGKFIIINLSNIYVLFYCYYYLRVLNLAILLVFFLIAHALF